VTSLSFDHVSKWYGKAPVLKDVCLEVKDGEFMVLVGPSGCGKTTLLRMVAGLEEGEGDIFIGDRCANGVQPQDRNIAMVFQSYALYPHMTVLQNLMFPLRMHKWGKDKAIARAIEVAGQLQIGELLSRKPKQLSGGQRQRVALGRAMVRNPAVFLMDEPLSNLDAHLRVKMRKELSDLHRSLGATFLYVTHDLGEALALADRVAVMDHGLIRQVGTPQEICDNPADGFVAEFTLGLQTEAVK
jgi:ABC-type sugar transport system ATPase subunit